MVRTESTSLTDLAVRAFDPLTPRADREVLLRELSDHLTPRARAYCRGDAALAEAIIQHALVQGDHGLFDPARGSFPAWFRVVTRNYLTDERRSPHRAVGGNSPHPERPDPRDHQRAREYALDFAAPFSATDLAAIGLWPPREQVIRLVRSLLWPKLPPTVWAGTLAAAGLPADFPGAGFADLGPAERNARLAAALGIRVNTLHVIWKRSRPALLGLRFIRDMIEP